MPAPDSAAAEVWQGVLARLSARLNAQVFQAWMAPMKAMDLARSASPGTAHTPAGPQHVLTLGVPTTWHHDWVRDHYLALLEETLGAELPRARIRLAVVPELDRPPPAAPVMTRAQAYAAPVPAALSGFGTSGGASPPAFALSAAAGAPAGSVGQASASLPPLPRRAAPSLNGRYSLESFVAGPSNQLAVAASQAVGDNPGRSYNPLFLFGGTGLGKTHLLHAIGNRIQQRHPDWNVLYLCAEDFTNDLIGCLQSGRMAEFRARYRTHCDVLLLDDIHFLAGKERTQEEFFHAFNHLHALGKQVVVTSDRFPHQMEGLEERLRTRLQWGLIADIQAPEVETRVAILNRKAAEHGVDLPGDVAQFLAGAIKNNVRELEGALVRVVAASSLGAEPLDVALCKRTLRDVVLRAAYQPTCADVIGHVCSYFNVSAAELKGKARNRSITTPRHVAMYLCRRHTHASFPEIGAAFGGKDHTTVMASVRKVEAIVQEDPAMAAAVEKLGRLLET